jgi:hypothetical protein
MNFLISLPLTPNPRSAPHNPAGKPGRLRQRESVIRETLPSPRAGEGNVARTCGAVFGWEAS